MPEPGGALLANLMHFARTLRAAGLPVGPGKVIDAVAAVGAIGITDRSDFYWTLHAVLVNRPDQRLIFDQAFHVFWRNPDLLKRMMSLVLPELRIAGEEDQGAAMARRLAEALHPEKGEGSEPEETETELDAVMTFSDRFLIKRPLLQALEPAIEGSPVLLIDELDRTDEPFEAYLLVLLSDFQVTIPEIGTIHAEHPPIVIITSNRTREIHDALKRRCFYYWVDYPTAARELEILERKVPGAGESLSREVVGFVQRLRGMDLFKLPGIAETIDWTEALMQLDVLELTPHAINDTLGVLLKYQDDIARLHGSEAARLLEQVKAEAAAEE